MTKPQSLVCKAWWCFKKYFVLLLLFPLSLHLGAFLFFNFGAFFLRKWEVLFCIVLFFKFVALYTAMSLIICCNIIKFKFILFRNAIFNSNITSDFWADFVWYCLCHIVSVFWKTTTIIPLYANFWKIVNVSQSILLFSVCMFSIKVDRAGFKHIVRCFWTVLLCDCYAANSFDLKIGLWYFKDYAVATFTIFMSIQCHKGASIHYQNV